MLGLALQLLLVAAVVTIVIYIYGTITRAKLKKKLREKEISETIITEIDRCDNIVRLEDLDSDKKIEVRGDDVSYSLDEGDYIYA